MLIAARAPPRYASLASSPFPIAARAASISWPRTCAARCSATAAHRCCP